MNDIDREVLIENMKDKIVKHFSMVYPDYMDMGSIRSAAYVCAVDILEEVESVQSRLGVTFLPQG